MNDELRDAAKAFDAGLPRGDAAWTADVEAALFAEATRDLPPAPGDCLTAPVAALDARALIDLCRRLLRERLRELGTGTVDDEPGEEWRYDPETGAPATAAPDASPKLIEALLRAGRGERVHPRCAMRPDLSGCDCPEHTHPANKQFAPLPRFTDWRKMATTAPVTILAWWTQWPTADVGTAGGTNRRGRFSRGPRDAAIQLLIDLLRVDNRGLEVGAIKRAAREAEVEISWKTMQRAAEEMGIESRPIEGAVLPWARWYWPTEAKQRFMARYLAPAPPAD